MIQAAGGQVYYNWQWSRSPAGEFADRKVRPNATPGGPKWLVDAVGPEYFGYVAYVFFVYETSQAIATWPASQALSDLRELHFMGPGVSDAGFAHLERLTKIEDLMAPAPGFPTTP